MTRIPGRALAALVVPLLCGLTGCTADPVAGDATAPPPPGALVLVVAAHESAPKPDLPATLQPLVTAAARAERRISVVRLDGDPAVTYRTGAYTVSSDSPQAAEDDVNGIVGAVYQAVLALRPTADGADVADAVSVAADEGAGEAPATIVLADPGLSDGGVPSLTLPGALAADPVDWARRVRSSGSITPLRSARVVLCGLGYTVPPQVPLTPALRATVTAIWRSVLRSAGAGSVTVLPTPRSGAGPTTRFAVRRLPVPDDVQVPTGRSSVWRADGPIGFEPGNARLLDKEGAAAALTGLAEWLRAGSGRTATITGTTAGGGTRSANRRLARQRADRVAALLVDAGVDRDRLTVRGVGTDFAAYVPDLLPSGELDPVKAGRNRTVRITPHG